MAKLPINNTNWTEYNRLRNNTIPQHYTTLKEHNTIQANGVIWGCLVLSGVVWCHKVFGVVWWHLVLFEFWCFFGVILYRLVSSGVIWCHLVSSGVIWCHLVSSGVTLLSPAQHSCQRSSGVT